jgi:hypothetical protein
MKNLVSPSRAFELSEVHNDQLMRILENTLINKLANPNEQPMNNLKNTLSRQRQPKGLINSATREQPEVSNEERMSSLKPLMSGS